MMHKTLATKTLNAKLANQQHCMGRAFGFTKMNITLNQHCRILSLIVYETVYICAELHSDHLCKILRGFRECI